MIRLRLSIALLALGIGAQWAVPGYLIQRGQATLQHGTVYRLRTAPVDPVDPFRGRYVALDFAAASIELPDARRDYRHGQRVYAPLRTGNDGFAWLAPPQAQPPAAGDYIEATVAWVNDDELRLRLPFDRYYLDEALAPEAEHRYREANRAIDDGADPRRPAWVQLRVRDGYALIEELYIEGRAVRELLSGS